MEKVVQIQVVPDTSREAVPGQVDIFALTDDGRLLIRPTKMSDYPTGLWTELTFPPQKAPTQSVQQ